MLDYRCPMCWKVFAHVSSNHDHEELQLCCPDCHEKRVQALPKTEDTSRFLGSATGKNSLPAYVYVYPSHAGKRVIRKSEPLAG
jgi:hypothetical protein